MKEFVSEKAIVRIHEGKLSAEERRVVIENAAKQFLQALEKKGQAEKVCLGVSGRGDLGILHDSSSCASSA